MGDPFGVDTSSHVNNPGVLRTPRLLKGDAFSVCRLHAPIKAGIFLVQGCKGARTPMYTAFAPFFKAVMGDSRVTADMKITLYGIEFSREFNAVSTRRTA